MSRLLKNGWMRSVVVPSLVFVLYFLVSLILAYWIQTDYLASAIVDVSVILVIGTMAFLAWFRGPKIPKDEKLKFSVFGWIVLLIAFAWLYFSSEAIGQWLSKVAPTSADSFYIGENSTSFYLYILCAVTIGPICEELIFRWVLFHHFREKLNFWISMGLSTLLFTLVHGTVMHAPITIILSLFICVMYEVTGQFKYCLLFHLLFNFMAATYVLGMIGMPVWGMFIIYGIVFVAIILAYVFRETVFKKWLRMGGLVQFEAYLDNKRMHFGEKISEQVKANKDEKMLEDEEKKS